MMTKLESTVLKVVMELIAGLNLQGLKGIECFKALEFGEKFAVMSESEKDQFQYFTKYSNESKNNARRIKTGILVTVDLNDFIFLYE